MFDCVDISLLGHPLDDVAVGANQQNRRPIVELEGVPDVELAVIDASVGDIVANDGLSEHMRGLFFVKFGAVDADKGHLREVFKFGLKLFELGQDMDAVDAAARPEVDD